MGIIKKYKIIYERNIIISNLIFKANRGKKPTVYPQQQQQQTMFLQYSVMSSLSKFEQRQFEIHLEKKRQ